MSVSIYTKGYYEDFYGFWRQKNKPNSKPNKANLLAFSVLHSADSVKKRKRNLKKQSQFALALKSVKSYLKGDYENKPRPGSRENKPKQSQSKHALSAVEWANFKAGPALFGYAQGSALPRGGLNSSWIPT